MNTGLSPYTAGLISAVFKKYSDIKRVHLFGSRAIGTYRDNSDIDLVIFDDIDEALLAKITGDLDELSLPYLFDVKVYGQIDNQSLREHIDRFSIPIAPEDAL